MKALKTVLLVAFVSILTLCFALPIACGDDDDDDDDDSSDDGSDVCADFCDVLAYCDMSEDLNVYTMDECLDFCLQVGTVGNCVIDAADCEAVRACFEEEGDDDTEEGDDDTEDTCPEGEIWDEQLGECIPEECGLDQYPEPPFGDKALLYVDASYTGDSDGSTEKPYKTIAEAISAAGENASILLTTGDYVETSTLQIELDGLDLVGRCSYLVKVRSAEGRTVLRVHDANSNLISGVACYTEGESDWTFPMIRLSGTSDTEFINNSVTDSTGKGLSADSCDGILISRNVFRGNTEAGIYSLHTNDIEISGNEILDTRLNEQGEHGNGIVLLFTEQVLVSENIVDGNIDAGIFLSESSGTISGNEVRATGADGQGNLGRGINIQDSQQVLVSANTIVGNADGGIFFSRASGTISENEVRDNIDIGIYVDESEQLSVIDNIVDSNTHVGIVFNYASGTIAGNQVRNTIPSEGTFGRGINVQFSEDVSVSNNTVEGNTNSGIFFGFTSGMILGNEIRNNIGRGIDVESSDQVSVSDNTVEGNTSEGILFYLASGTISGNQVQDNFSIGIWVQESEDVSTSTNIVEGNTNIGIMLDLASGMITGNEVRGTLPGIPNDEGYTFGHGIHVQASTDVESSLNIVENNLHAGIFYILTENGNIQENDVSGTSAESWDTFNFGDGIVVVGIEGLISIQDNILDGNDRCGVLADFSTGMIQRNEIFGNENSIVAQNNSVMDISDNDIHDNDVNDVQLFEGQELPVQDSMIE